MRRLAAQYPRYGYRRIRIFLRREGQVMSPDRAHRLWRHAGLQVPRRRPRRRVATGRPRPRPPTARNHVWAYDFVFDTCANRQTLTCLTIVDEWTRECLAIDVAGGIRSGRVIEVLAPLVSVQARRGTGGPRAMNKLSRLSAPLGRPIEGQIRAQAQWSRPIVRHPDSYPRSGGCQAEVRRAVFDAKGSGQRWAWPPLRLEPEPQVSTRRSIRPSTRGQHRTPCGS